MDHLRETEKDASADLTDGLKLLYDDGWILVRPSGTEPLFRIFSESKDSKKAAERADRAESTARDFIRRC
jgi:phosphomannomutase/phosphoglucomutase